MRDPVEPTNPEQASESRVGDSPSVAIVGAGLAGSTCARILGSRGVSVRAFDKGRGAGGRMATRRARAEEDAPVHFDHGAQYFTVRDPRFREYVEAWIDRGRVKRWEGRFGTLHESGFAEARELDVRYVGVPKMSAVVGGLAESVGVEFGTRVETARRTEGRWRLTASDGSGLGTYDRLVVALPAPQAAHLLSEVSSSVVEAAAKMAMAPTWAALLAFAEPLEVGFDGARVEEGPLAWMAQNSSKPGRPDTPCWVVHASHDWSRDHLEDEFEEVAQRMLGEFLERVGRPEAADRCIYRRAHRWRYAEADPPRNETVLEDSAIGLTVAGDWLSGSRVEGAFLSGAAAAKRLYASLEGEGTA